MEAFLLFGSSLKAMKYLKKENLPFVQQFVNIKENEHYRSSLLILGFIQKGKSKMSNLLMNTLNRLSPQNWIETMPPTDGLLENVDDEIHDKLSFQKQSLHSLSLIEVSRIFSIHSLKRKKKSHSTKEETIEKDIDIFQTNNDCEILVKEREKNVLTLLSLPSRQIINGIAPIVIISFAKLMHYQFCQSS